jgi:hypothetical protein
MCTVHALLQFEKMNIEAEFMNEVSGHNRESSKT